MVIAADCHRGGAYDVFCLLLQGKEKFFFYRQAKVSAIGFKVFKSFFYNVSFAFARQKS